MKKIFIETCLNDLFIAAVDKVEVVGFKHIKDLQKKADNIASTYQELMNEVGWVTKEVNAFYVTKGPGSFMGARVGLLFARTICQLEDIRLYTTDTLTFISMNHPGSYHIDAKGDRFFTLTIDRHGNKEYSIEEDVKETKVNYKDIIKHIADLIPLYKLETELDTVVPHYMKEPKVGA